IVPAGMAAALAAVIIAAQPASPPVFTPAQAAAGRTAYDVNCANCHMPDLAGRNEAPPLAGGTFLNAWRNRSTKHLFDRLTATVPGTDQPPGQRGVTTLNGPTGLTVRGEVKNYVPVTGDMLRNPDPGDWLMARRTYQGWSYSPLTSITRDSVKELQLAWVWTMQDGGANEPTPLVHGGTMFLTNTANVIQALDAKTGELIWEHRIPPYALIGAATMRNIALYDDKV